MRLGQGECPATNRLRVRSSLLAILIVVIPFAELQFISPARCQGQTRTGQLRSPKGELKTTMTSYFEICVSFYNFKCISKALV